MRMGSECVMSMLEMLVLSEIYFPVVVAPLHLCDQDHVVYEPSPFVHK